MIPTIFLIRHERTELNDPGNERIRGYSDVPLSNDGVANTRKTAAFLGPWAIDIQRILVSPLQRTMMTSSIVGEIVQARVVPTRGLLPWDLGKLTGQPIKEMAPRMDYFQEFPDIKVPGGESYRNFFLRWSDCLDKMQQYAEEHMDQILLGITHSRNLLALPAVLGKRPIGDVPVKGGPGPGSVSKLYKPSDTWKFETIFEVK